MIPREKPRLAGRTSGDASTGDSEITDLLSDWGERSPDRESRLFDFVYPQLLQIAERLLRRERADHTLDPSGLVHEGFLRLLRQRRNRWRSRGHFYAVAAMAMRRVLQDYGRRKSAAKRGTAMTRVALNEAAVSDPPTPPVEATAALREALETLLQEDHHLAEIVELRFFGGLTLDETAIVLKKSRTSVVADWAKARAWLGERLG